MKRNYWIVVLLIVAAALAVIVVRQNRQINQAKEQPPLAAAAETPKATSAPAPVRRRPEPAPLPEAAPSESATPPSLASAAVAEANAGSGSTNNLFSNLAGMMKNPNMKEMVRAQQKYMIDQTYNPLSKYLNLTAEQMAALKNLLAERQMATVDVGLAMMSGSEAERKQAMQQAKAITEDYNQKIKELLSPQDYQSFQDYEKTTAERTQVQMFKGTLPADAMLTDQQEFDLISAMYEARKSMPASQLSDRQKTDPSKMTDDQIADMVKQLDTMNQQYLERAKAILTPQQFQQFQESVTQWSAMQTMGLKMARQMFGGNAPQQEPAPATQNPSTQ